MEAVVDMTPRLRIPSSSRKEQRSLSPSLPLSFSLSPLKCVTLFFYLAALSLTAASAFTSFLFHPFPQPPSHTQKHIHTKMTFDISRNHKSPYMSLKTMTTHTQTRAIALTNSLLLSYPTVPP